MQSTAWGEIGTARRQRRGLLQMERCLPRNMPFSEIWRAFSPASQREKPVAQLTRAQLPRRQPAQADSLSGRRFRTHDLQITGHARSPPAQHVRGCRASRRLHAHWVMRLIKSGAIAASRIGRQIRIAPQDLEAFRLAQRTK